MSQPFRLAEGGLIERTRPLRFRFDGHEFDGFEGDTLASALLANGVRLVGRSFKYHRPRGIVTTGAAEPNALVELRTRARLEPNTRATEIALFDGLEAKSQNRWPSLDFDILGLNNRFSALMPAGFYYKTFMWPARAWLTYEKIIRRAAGLGRGGLEPDPDAYERMNVHADVLVVGGGPAGLAAALAAGRSGARVTLLDAQDDVGGALRGEREEIDGAPALDWVRSVVAELEDLPEVTLLRRTSAFGYYDDNVVGAVERVADHLALPPPHTVRQRYWKLRARRVVLATGAQERPLVFADNDRPGVMLASAVRSYRNRFAVIAGRRAVVFANNDSGYRTALDLRAAGVEVGAVVDPRTGTRGTWAETAWAAGIECLVGSVVVRATGAKALDGVEVMELDADGAGVAGGVRRIECDLLAVSGGFEPTLHLYAQAGGRPVYDPGLGAFRPGAGARGRPSVAGAANGDLALADCLAHGSDAGAEAARSLGFSISHAPEMPMVEMREEAPMRPLWQVPLPATIKGKRFVDFQNDVTVEDIRLAHREGYVSVEHLKRYTTLGMGTDQGKTANVNGLAIMAEARGVEIEAVGTTTYRPPYQPVAIGALVGADVGDHEAPIRRTAMHDWHAANGGVFVEAGLWKRPNYYLKAGESRDRATVEAAVAREVTGVREGVGLVDVSTLGKIDIQGPDAAEFLNRLYTNGWKTLAVGKARYGLMLREDGLVWDDGTTSRLAEHRYLMTTTTTNAGPVMSHLEYYLQVVWPELRVKAVSVTEQWAAMALAGPRARDVLAKVAPGLDVSNEALPFMGVADTEVAGVPARVFRISFSGELSYEINVGADYGEPVWRAILEAGAAEGIIAYGTEAMAVMRIEKGHVAGGELDGRTTADDLGLGRMQSSRKEFIGSRMIDAEAFLDEMRPKFVGLVPVDGTTRIEPGAILVEEPDQPMPMAKLGHVSASAYVSPTLGHPVSLGFCARGRERLGETVWALSPLHGQRLQVRLADPVFYDPDGGRQRG
ncbi:MAG: sarcosine oxidase subunit alpha family protein [Alphaproteobacteria bacterium]|nr:sarcosine oxidase subunit alpha family protein [Alphaproteobacteria bacterium]